MCCVSVVDWKATQYQVLVFSSLNYEILSIFFMTVQFNSQGSSISSQSSMGLGVQSPSLSGVSSASLQQPNSVHSPSSQQLLVPGVAKDAGILCYHIRTSLVCFDVLLFPFGNTFFTFLISVREWLKYYDFILAVPESPLLHYSTVIVCNQYLLEYQRG